VVDAIGRDVTGFRVGDRVATLSYHSYADFDVMPATSLARLPEDWGEDPFPAEPLACAWNVFQRCQIQSGQTVAIVGIGFLGALLTQLAASSGARVLAISRRAFARNVAAACGADYVFSLEDPEATVRNIGNTLGDDGCDCVIEATGSQSALDVASQLVRIRGRLVIAGYHQDGLRQINLQQWNWKGIDVINAHERDPAIYLEGMRHAMNAVAKGTLDPAPLLTHHYALDELSSAFRDSIERPSGFMKAVVWTRQE
jgi:threonine dehydrogenase-like Zn-dependent dehydrogenase